MLNLRNLMSHTYDEAIFVAAVGTIQARFLAALNAVYILLKKQA